MSGPLPLETVVQHYAWGSRTLIPALLGLPAPSPEPWAELWVGAHPGGPSRLPDGRTLDQVEPDLPFLLKLLSATEPLSLQAHPDGAQAAAGYAREQAAGVAFDAPDRTYKDPNAKPEMLVALTPFAALVAFRPPRDSLRLVQALQCPQLAGLAAALAHPQPAQAVREAFTLCMTIEVDHRASLVRTVAAAAAGHAADPTTDPGDALACGWVARLALGHVADVGVLAPLLMHTVVLAPGQAVTLRPRTLHAYLSGAAIEVMASSDNVIRGGLTNKHVDVAALLSVIDFEPTALPEVVPQRLGPAVELYDGGDRAFRLLRVQVDGPARVPCSGPRLVLATAGPLEVRAGTGSVRLPAGRAAYVPADAADLVLDGTGAAWVAERGAGPASSES